MPPEIQFQRAGCLPKDLLRPFRSKSRGGSRGAGGCRTMRIWRGRMRPERRAVCPSFLAGDQTCLIQPRLIARLSDSPERIEPPLAALTLVEEMPDRLFDQFAGALVAATVEFLLDLFCQIRR